MAGTLLDLVTIIVLGSGVYLWLFKRSRALPERRADRAAIQTEGELLDVRGGRQ